MRSVRLSHLGAGAPETVAQLSCLFTDGCTPAKHDPEPRAPGVPDTPGGDSARASVEILWARGRGINLEVAQPPVAATLLERGEPAAEGRQHRDDADPDRVCGGTAE